MHRISIRGISDRSPPSPSPRHLWYGHGPRPTPPTEPLRAADHRQHRPAGLQSSSLQLALAAEQERKAAEQAAAAERPGRALAAERHAAEAGGPPRRRAAHKAAAEARRSAAAARKARRRATRAAAAAAGQQPRARQADGGGSRLGRRAVRLPRPAVDPRVRMVAPRLQRFGRLRHPAGPARAARCPPPAPTGRPTRAPRSRGACPTSAAATAPLRRLEHFQARRLVLSPRACVRPTARPRPTPPVGGVRRSPAVTRQGPRMDEPLPALTFLGHSTVRLDIGGRRGAHRPDPAPARHLPPAGAGVPTGRTSPRRPRAHQSPAPRPLRPAVAAPWLGSDVRRAGRAGDWLRAKGFPRVVELGAACFASGGRR